MRVHRSLLAAAEKTLLLRMAAALPRWVSPDQLTALGVAGEHRISGAVFGPTELRIALIAMNIALWSAGAPKGFLGYAGLSWCDALMLAAFAVMMLVFLVSVTTDARSLRGERGERDVREDANRDQRP